MGSDVAAGYLSILRSHRDELRSYGVGRVGVFGSIARGEEWPESDIDILVEIAPERKTYDNYLNLADYLEELFSGRHVDLVTDNAISRHILPYVLDETRQIKVG